MPLGSLDQFLGLLAQGGDAIAVLLRAKTIRIHGRGRVGHLGFRISLIDLGNLQRRFGFIQLGINSAACCVRASPCLRSAMALVPASMAALPLRLSAAAKSASVLA